MEALRAVSLQRAEAASGGSENLPRHETERWRGHPSSGPEPDLLADGHGLEGPGTQDVDGPAHVEALAQPARARRPRVQVEPRALVACSERPDGIVGDRQRGRDVGQRSSVRSPEPQLAVGLPFHLISLLVDSAVMAPTEEREVRKRGGPALSPMTDVMPLAKRHAAAREPAAAITMV